MRIITTLSASILALASAAAASGPDRISDMQPKMPTEAEQTWAANLWKVMKTGATDPVKGVLKGAYTWTAGGRGITSKAGDSVRTVQLQARHGDRTVARLRFRTGADALTYAANVDVRTSGQLTLVEVRGKQVVVLSIPGQLPEDGWTKSDLERIDEIAAVRKAAWATLPAPSARDSTPQRSILPL